MFKDTKGQDQAGHCIKSFYDCKDQNVDILAKVCLMHLTLGYFKCMDGIVFIIVIWYCNQSRSNVEIINNLSIFGLLKGVRCQNKGYDSLSVNIGVGGGSSWDYP